MASLADDLGARVTRLERTSRRDRAIGFAVIACLFLSAQAPGSAPPSGAPIVIRDTAGASAVLTARGLTMRDPAGKERAFFGLDADDLPSVDMRDVSGTLRQTMYLTSSGHPTVRQFDQAGKRRLQMFLDVNDDGGLQLQDASEKSRVYLWTSKGVPTIGLYGSDEKLRAYLSTDDVLPYFVMRDAGGTTRVHIGGYTDNSLGIDIRNASNTVQWKAP